MRFVGSIVVVGNTRSTTVSAGVELSTQPINAVFVLILEPIGVPVLSAN